MKQLSDGTQVLSRTYYYLLEWNEADLRQYINKKFNKQRLIDLTKDEYKQLFQHATENDLNRLNKK